MRTIEQKIVIIACDILIALVMILFGIKLIWGG